MNTNTSSLVAHGGLTFQGPCSMKVHSVYEPPRMDLASVSLENDQICVILYGCSVYAYDCYSNYAYAPTIAYSKNIKIQKYVIVGCLPRCMKITPNYSIVRLSVSLLFMSQK